MDDLLNIQWKGLAVRYSADEVLVNKLFQEIKRRYSHSGRHYHNLEHIAALLRLSEKYASELAYKEIVDFAIFYHDIIYNVWRKDNEKRSAVLATKRLTELGVPAEKVMAVALFIEATNAHTLPADSLYENDLSFFLDFDMSILGAEWSDYLNYVQQVRKEYHIYPDLLYRPGRTQFLQKTLSGGPIFHTTVFRALYEEQARKNMEREIQWLNEG